MALLYAANASAGLLPRRVNTVWVPRKDRSPFHPAVGDRQLHPKESRSQVGGDRHTTFCSHQHRRRVPRHGHSSFNTKPENWSHLGTLLVASFQPGSHLLPSCRTGLVGGDNWRQSGGHRQQTSMGIRDSGRIQAAIGHAASGKAHFWWLR
jgi:hypothetical protein